ncbi:cytochrome c oxidase assembly protein [Caulobacter sp. LARHSG274]
MQDLASTWTPYCGAGSTPADAWLRWNLDPMLLLVLAVAGAVLLWRAPPSRRGLAGAALAVLAVAFVSPLCALSSALFSARTVHHVLLAAVAAPLIAWSLPAARRRQGRLHPSSPLLFALTFWAWHAPRLYDWALSNDLAYWLMQASILGSATALWRSVRAVPPPTGVAILLATVVQTGLLGALLVFMPEAIYAPHALTTAAWGLSPLADQQIAGLIMWAPAAGIYLAAALAILGRCLKGAPGGLRPA